MISGRRYLKTKFEDNTFIHYRYVAYILNIIVTAGLKVINVHIKKLRKLMKTIRKSPKILEELENLTKLNNKTFLRPIIDCKMH